MSLTGRLILASISFVLVGRTGRRYGLCGDIVIASSIVKKLCVIALFSESDVGEMGVAVVVTVVIGLFGLEYDDGCMKCWIFGFSVWNDILCASLSLPGHFGYICSSLNDGVGGVVLDKCENPLYANRFASCNGEMAGILYLWRMSIALRSSSTSKIFSIGGPTGDDGETVNDGEEVVNDGLSRNRLESVCLYGGGGTRLIAYSSFSIWNGPLCGTFNRLSEMF